MEPRGNQPPTILTAQIIVAALMMGVIMFAVMTLFMGLAPEVPEGEEPPTPVISFVMVTFAVTALMARFVVPGILVSTQRKRLLSDNEEQQRKNFMGIFMTKTIVENALPEGAAFACLVAYMVEGQVWMLAVVGVILAVMALGFPTPGRFESWYRAQRELAGLDR